MRYFSLVQHHLYSSFIGNQVWGHILINLFREISICSIRKEALSACRVIYICILLKGIPSAIIKLLLKRNIFNNYWALEGFDIKYRIILLLMS